MKKRIVYLIVGLALVVGLFFGVKAVREEFYPVDVPPSPEWEPYVSALDAEREFFFVDSDGTKLEAELFIPDGGSEEKAAVVFSPGSGDAAYQNYAWGFVEKYILDLFLSRDMAVLLINKRGMGLSEGDYTRSSIEGRAEDIYAAVEQIISHPKINEKKIGLVGHSEGGWVVSYAAAKNPDVAFFISLAGPMTTRLEQAKGMYSYEAICLGFEGQEYDEYLEKRIKNTELGIKIGKTTNFGLLGFDYRTMSFDPANALQTVQSPGLFVFAENDILVIPDHNTEQMDEIFNGNVPDHISVETLDSASHTFHLVDTPCDSWSNLGEKAFSEQAVEIINTWLEEQGY